MKKSLHILVYRLHSRNITYLCTSQ